ncbi:MAG: tRNA 4-thiouridine(8) synthase ThiI [Actinobacteria bacterium]|nr:tRNA 4-thiouridine(8) synthase ThiI [Actinomycetota bacterium]
MEVIEIRPPRKKPEGKSRAFLLFSGGLDSALAGLVLIDAGVDVLPLTFKSPFFGYETALKMAERLDWPLIVVDITNEQLRIVEKPKYGYGKNLNPCIDCHAQMIKIACQLKDDYQVDFVATGEVLNERPKSQTRKALEIVAKESGCEEYLVRPLSAKLFPATKAEEKGLVDREKLLDISGRSRKRQIELAKKYGLTDFPSPAGGCLLTDPVFSARLRKLIKWRGHLFDKDIELVKYGRNFFESDYWIVVSRNEYETRMLEKIILDTDVRITTYEAPGPLTIVRFKESIDSEKMEKAVDIASLLTIRYSKLREKETASVSIKQASSEKLKTFSKDDWLPYLNESYMPQF